MKKLFLSIMLLALPLLASAYDCQVDGIYYNLIPKGNVAEVTSGDTKYSGSVTIPEKFTYEGVEYSVTSIGGFAFFRCSLTSVTIPNSVTSIEGSAFLDCSGPTSVHITDLAAWCKMAFSNYDSNPLYHAHHLYLNGEEIKDLVIPNSVTSIGNYAFNGFSGLTSVTIPNSVTSIGGDAFNGCSGLTSVTIPNSVTSIGNGAFNGCTGLTSVTIPNSVTSIGRNAFSYCSGLISVTIPNSVTSIGYYAFQYCTGLTSVTIGSSVSGIGGKAFADCSKLEEVHCLAEEVPSTNTDAFEKSYPEYTTLYVPAGSLNDYKTTEPWSQFGTIKGIGGTGEEPTKCATPTISYADKRLTFSCETEGVEYVYEITDTDIKKGYDAEVDLSATYEISVYATKAGYENSDIATATLVWTDAIFTVTTPETPTSAKEVKESIPVLISANGGVITVKSEQEGQAVAVYTADGKALGSANVKGGQATVATNMQRGEIVIVKVGGRSVKVKM